MIVFGFISHEAEGTAAMLFCKFFAYATLINTSGTVSALSLAAIAFERYQAVVHPLTVRRNITKRKTLQLIVISWILALCATMPWVPWLDLDKSVPPRCKVRAKYKEAVQLYSYFFGVCAYGVPLLTVSVLYAQISREFFKKQNQTIDQNQQVAFRTKKKMIAMLITVTSIFAVLWAVGTAIHMVYDNTSFGASLIALILLINSSINWVLYALFSKQFRNCFKKALASCSKAQEPSGGYPRGKENPMRNGVVDTRL